MTVTEDQQREHPLGLQLSAPLPSLAREVINEMLDAGLLDDVMDRVDAGGLRLTGEGGFLPEMTKPCSSVACRWSRPSTWAMRRVTRPGAAALTRATAPPPRRWRQRSVTCAWTCRATVPGHLSPGWSRRALAALAASTT